MDRQQIVWVLSFLLFLVALRPSISSAEPIRCDNCTASERISATKRQGAGTHYVYDLANAHVQKLEAARVCEAYGSCVMEVTPAPVEGDIARFVIELAVYGEMTGGTFKSHFRFNATDTGASHLSAFDVAGPGGPRQQLIDALRSSEEMLTVRNALPAIGAGIHQVIVTIGRIWSDNVGNTLITIEFPDGSEITLSYEVINDTYTVVEGSAKDKYGNTIPATADQLDGTRFDYSREGPNGPAQQRMRNYIGLWGVRVTTGVRWGCIRVGDGSWSCFPF